MSMFATAADYNAAMDEWLASCDTWEAQDFIAAANPEVILRLVAIARAAEKALSALERSYEATEWPADGTSTQEIAAAALREAIEVGK